MTADSARERIAAQIVGRERELDLLLAAVVTGRDVVLEGPPGTSKTTMLKAITREWDVPLVLAEGNAELTPAKLLGYHDPARVMREGYSAATFVDGPLVQAMRSGSFLYVEEFNRAPEDTLNALLTAIADRSLAIPRVGVVEAEPTFRVLASMNPYDNVGTTRLSTSIRDRLCRIDVGYQDAPSELEIVLLRTGLDARRRDRPTVPHTMRWHSPARHVSTAISVTGAAFVARSTSACWRASLFASAASTRPRAATPRRSSTRCSSRYPGGSWWTKPPARHRPWFCARFGKTTSFSTRRLPSPAEEDLTCRTIPWSSAETRMQTAADRCAGDPNDSTSLRCLSTSTSASGGILGTPGPDPDPAMKNRTAAPGSGAPPMRPARWLAPTAARTLAPRRSTGRPSRSPPGCRSPALRSSAGAGEAAPG